MRRTLLACAFLAAPGAACLLSVDESLLDGASDASDGSTDGSTDDTVQSASPDGGTDGGPSGRCAVEAGATMVGIGDFCIDVREATVFDYRAFLASSNRAPRPPECAFKTTNEPPTWPYPHSEDALSMTNVDWCDAWAYCAWAGKRLCGGRNGAALDFSLVTTPTDEFYRACTNGRTSTFPYGTTFDASVCNVVGYQMPNKLLPPGGATACHGAVAPYSNITDLVGNVAEWTRSCEPDAGNDAGEDNCRLRGAGWYTVSQDGCIDDNFYPRGSASPSTGIRCCADPQ